MAVQFLNNINLNNNQLQGFKVDNQGSDPQNLGGEGQLIYRTDLDVLRYHTGSNNWVTLASSAANYASWELRSDTGIGGAFDVINGAVVTISGDTAITTSNTLGAVEIDLNDTAVNPGSYTYASITVDQQGRLTAAGSGTAPATPSDATITLNTGAGFTAASGDAFTLNQAGNETINFVIGAGPGIQVNSTSVQVDYTGANNIIDSAAAGTTLVVTDKFIAEDLSDNIVKEYEIQDIIDLVPSGDTYDLRVSSGATAGARVNLDAGAGTDTFVDFEAVTTTMLITKSDGVNGEVIFDLADNVTIATSLSVPSASITGGASNALNITGKGRSAATTGADNALTLTTKGYVDGLAEGGLTFLGTFRADTGEILSGGNDGSYLYNVPGGAGTRVAVAVGDYYVVATAGGNFYANATYPLDIGDSIIGVETAAADTSVLADWSLVSQGVTVNSVNTTDGTFINLTPNSATTGAVVVTADLSAIDGTSNSATRFLSKDNTWDVPSYVSYGVMTTSTLGLGKLRYSGGSTPTANAQSTTAGRTYGVTMNGSNQLIVNVPWDANSEGVETFTNANGTYVSNSVVNTSASGDVTTGTVDLSAVDGTSVAATRFLSKDNTWDVPTFPTSSDFGVLTVGASTAANRLGIAISGTAQNPLVGLNITGLTSATPVASDTIPFYDAGTNKKTTVANLTAAVQTATSKAYTIASGETTDDLTYPFTLTAATINDVMVQAVISSGANAGETVFCDVDRISTTVCRITFGSALTTSVRVLVQKIG
tara:strand:- start:1757 stop:4063 length:2307 start_codon:yes stop_codon:yes gene_type:complete